MRFSDKQLKILDCIKPFVDSEYVEDRKGRSQSYPVISITESNTYWCVDAGEMLHPPTDLIGDWICTSLYDNEYSDWVDVRDDRNWSRAVYKAVEVMKWVSVDEK